MSDPLAPNADLSLLAPKFRASVQAALAACNNAARPGGALTAKVFEGYRSAARQADLYAQGRTKPGDIVTRASTNLTSWHGYGLAVDVVHQTKFWKPFGSDAAKNEQWFADVAAVFKANGCNWGGDWNHPDTPHMQWGRCSASPTAGAQALITGPVGVQAVWAAVEAIDGGQPTPLASASAAADVEPPPLPFAALTPGGFFSGDPFDFSVRRSIRTNNPGALNVTEWQRAYRGFRGVTAPDSAKNVTSIYRTPEHGVGAWFHLLTVRYNFRAAGSPRLIDIAQRYAGDPDPQAPAVRTYIQGWASASGGALSEQMETRLDNDADVLRLAKAMFHHEAGMPSPLHDDQVACGVDGERHGTLPLH